MTSPEMSVSEAEVDAAARAYKRWKHRECCTGASLDDVCAVLSPSDIGGARAALTAAAQVRERAGREQPIVCRWCGVLHYGGPENCGRPEAEPAKGM